MKNPRKKLELMNKINQINEMSIGKKVMLCLRIMLGLGVITSALLGLFNIVDSSKTINVTVPLLGVMFLLMGIDDYGKNKIMGYLNFFVAAIIFLAGISILLEHTLLK